LILDRDTAPAIAPWDNWRKSLPNERLCRVSMLSILVLLATALTSGCMSVPTDAAIRATNAVLPVSKVAVDIDVDGRSRYRDFFCTLAEDHGVSAARRQNNCDALLWRLSDEAPSAGKVQPAPFDTSLQIFVVGGAFSSCFGSASTVFPKAIERLSAKGYAIDTLAVNSRSSADYNASMIATSLADISEAPIILVGYSKGAVDIAHFLVNYPEIAARVVAVLSLAGPLMGSIGRGSEVTNAATAYCDPAGSIASGSSAEAALAGSTLVCHSQKITSSGGVVVVPLNCITSLNPSVK